MLHIIIRSMFTCTICFVEYLDCSRGAYLCYADSCSTVICLNCENKMHEMYESTRVHWINNTFSWVCSYKCMLEYSSSTQFDMDKCVSDSIPYLHHKEAEKEIFNKQLCAEIMYPNDLSKMIIEYIYKVI